MSAARDGCELSIRWPGGSSLPVEPFRRPDSLPRPAVERHAEDELRGGYARGEEVRDRAVGGVLPRVRGRRVEVRVVAGRLPRVRDAEVVGHEVDEVDGGLDLRHLRVLDEVAGGAGGEGQEEVPPGPGALAVEGRAQAGHEGGEVLLVLRPVRVVVAGQARVLPVHVEAVEVVAPHEVHGARDEHATALRGQRGVREPLRPRPAADGHQDLEVRVVLPQAGQHLQVVGVAGTALDDPAAHDVGEREVDVGELLSADLVRLEDAVAGEDVGDDRRPRGFGGGGRGRPGRQQQREERRGVSHVTLRPRKRRDSISRDAALPVPPR